MDWNYLKTFLAVAEHGSLSQAADALQITQPTAGRHVQALQRELGVELFTRHARGMALSPHGASLYDMAQEVRRGVARLEMGALGLSEDVRGTVRISAARVVADYILPGALIQLRREHPDIELEIVAQDDVANLLYRDVDLAVRMMPPQTESLFGRQIGLASLGLYASKAYLESHPPLHSTSDFDQHTVLGYDTQDLALRALRRAGVQVQRQDFNVRSDAQTFHVQAVVAGLGIGAMQDAIAARWEHLVRLDLGVAIDPLPVWLLTHESLRHSRRVRAAMACLGEELSKSYGGRNTPQLAAKKRGESQVE